MRITPNQRPDGTSQYLIDLDGTENANFRDILEGWLDALEFHEMKSRDYKARGKAGSNPWSLGIKGEYPGISRKLQKLHEVVWEGKDLLFEGAQEIIMDMMGALGLMLHEQKLIKDKYSASWRDNHGNKPTFGPGPAQSGRPKSYPIIARSSSIEDTVVEKKPLLFDQ